jgi:hypothetical protein
VEDECRVLQEKAKKQKLQAGTDKKSMALKQQTETSQQRQKTGQAATG